LAWLIVFATAGLVLMAWLIKELAGFVPISVSSRPGECKMGGWWVGDGDGDGDGDGGFSSWRPPPRDPVAPPAIVHSVVRFHTSMVGDKTPLNRSAKKTNAKA
jgi:hypothetical protein